MLRASIDLLNGLLAKLNLKISSYREFRRLVDRSAEDQRRLHEAERTHVERLDAAERTYRERLDAAERTYRERLDDAERIYSARLQRLGASQKQLSFRLVQEAIASAALSAEKRLGAKPAENNAASGKKHSAIVVMTSVAQVTQLKALAGAPRIRDAYDFVVVAYVEAARYGIVDFCRKNQITLLSHDMKTLCGERDFFEDEAELELSGDGFSLSTAFNGCAEDDRRSLQDVASLAAEVHRQHSIAIDARRVLVRAAASLLIMFEDNAEYATGIWATVAQSLSVSSVILPYTIADRLEAAEAHHHDPAFWAEQGVFNRLAKNTMPHWLHFYRDRWLLRRNGVSIVAAEALGVAPPMPWILNSSKADVIAVESEAMREHYLAQGIAESQLRVTGSVTDDLLHAAESEKAEIRGRIGLDAHRPILLCSFPPNQLSDGRLTCEFPTFHEIADFWLGELARLKDWQIVVKPHPAMRAEDIDYLKAFELHVSEMDTTSLLPLCDLYNPSVSSTIRWALACGKPVLNYDVYKYRYQDFASEQAVVTVFEAEEFSGALQRLTGDGEVLAQYAEKAKAAAARWGMLDGQSVMRIADLFDDLVRKQPMH